MTITEQSNNIILVKCLSAMYICILYEVKTTSSEDLYYIILQLIILRK